MKTIISLSAWPIDFFSSLVQHARGEVTFKNSPSQTKRGTIRHGAYIGNVRVIYKQLAGVSTKCYTFDLANAKDPNATLQAIIDSIKQVCNTTGTKFLTNGWPGIEGPKVAVMAKGMQVYVLSDS